MYFLFNNLSRALRGTTLKSEQHRIHRRHRRNTHSRELSQYNSIPSSCNGHIFCIQLRPPRCLRFLHQDSHCGPASMTNRRYMDDDRSQLLFHFSADYFRQTLWTLEYSSSLENRSLPSHSQRNLGEY